MRRYVCELCGYEYEPKKGDDMGGIEQGTDFEDLPDGWVCPSCAAEKDDFEIIDSEE